MTDQPTDLKIAQAVMAAAAAWTYIPGKPEAELERVLTLALRRDFAHVDAPRQTRFDVPDWSPCPSGIDILIRHRDGRPRIPIELKIEATDQTLWDAFKIAALRRLPGVECGYLICAAREATWARGGNCIELFPARLFEGGVLDSLELFEQNRRAWTALLKGGKARPTKIPSQLELRAVAVATCALASGYELRAVRITPRGGFLRFDGDWPHGIAI